MPYSITELAKLAGISSRTLRFYDQIELLKSERDFKNNYRYYGQEEVDRLQKIMFFKLFDLPLDRIKEILDAPEETQYQALMKQREQISNEQRRLEVLLTSLDQTLATMKGAAAMSDAEKFAAFKAETIEKNELQYGKEIRKKYGEETIDSSNKKIKGLSEADVANIKDLEEQLLVILKQLTGTTNLKDEQAKHLFELHKEWLLSVWPKGLYSSSAHKGLADLYVNDPRFTQYYEEKTGKKGAAETLKNIIYYHA
ncbi:MerR family transcriptional regulator [Ligilactobacillus salitolerans]|uniref:MerR family transcriptional regulator n=1 Tax=Ligilactobacillus salitolerans TaxID=1808352 RepID=A0A401IVM5_9LACO|nr:MerR family transcriptional regulator [Ligilactobacillus salitolerans]GBG95590.1 MerR family transcriptional regulator [Ligilactobacillus salitolerans]